MSGNKENHTCFTRIVKLFGHSPTKSSRKPKTTNKTTMKYGTSTTGTPSSPTATIFQVYDIEPNEYFIEDCKDDAISQEEKLGETKFPMIEDNHMFRYSCARVLQGSAHYEANSGKWIKSSRNGFVDTTVDSYRGHHNLVIRPDDVWIAILTQFSFYINKNSEKFRNQFVNFDDKIDLVVTIIGDFNIDTAPYDFFLTAMTDLVQENLVDDEIKSWILPNFSTTTEDDKLIGGVALMATMKNYFNYEFRMMICGIPYVTLEGTIEDWVNIRQRLEKLREYQLNHWVEMLVPILDQFVMAKSGKVDMDFWKNIVQLDYWSGEGFYSVQRTFISGWITTFCYFDKDGVEIPFEKSKKKLWPKIELEDIVRGSVDVNVLINDHGKIYKSILLAGHLATETLQDKVTLQPRPGWAIALKEN